MDLGLRDRRALVTAASKGLGRACAEALIAEGAHVFISSRNPEATAREIGAAGWLAADLASPDEPARLVSAATQALGGLDILVENSGPPPVGTFQSTSLEAWQAGFEGTLMSAVRLVTAALPYLKQSDQGRIVFVTSISVRQPLPNIVLSNALRGGVTGLAKTLSRELAPDGITVNCLAPDAILTDRIRQLAGSEEGVRAMGERAPMRRLGNPAEFAAACAFLCSRQAGYISGQTIGVDGASLLGVH